MDNFDKQENKGRLLFKSILDLSNITDASPATDKFDSVDYYFTNKGRKIGVEIKTRAAKYECYSTHLMELVKYETILLRIKSKELDGAYYINFFGDNICYIYNLHTIAKGIANREVVKELKLLNRTTVIYQGVKLKDVLLIPIGLALKITKVNGKWVKCL